MKYIFYIEMGGLMEDPAFHWERDGVGEGDSPEQAADKFFGDKYPKEYNFTQRTVWGWKTGYINSDGGITPLS